MAMNHQAVQEVGSLNLECPTCGHTLADSKVDPIIKEFVTDLFAPQSDGTRLSYATSLDLAYDRLLAEGVSAKYDKPTRESILKVADLKNTNPEEFENYFEKLGFPNTNPSTQANSTTGSFGETPSPTQRTRRTPGNSEYAYTPGGTSTPNSSASSNPQDNGTGLNGADIIEKKFGRRPVTQNEPLGSTRTPGQTQNEPSPTSKRFSVDPDSDLSIYEQRYRYWVGKPSPTEGRKERPSFASQILNNLPEPLKVPEEEETEEPIKQTTGPSPHNSNPTDPTNYTVSGHPIVVEETIVVKAGTVFDGKGQTYTAGSALGDGGQAEGQKPIFILEDGASLVNVVIGKNGADGVHTYGDAKIDNVHWSDVGEDAMTMKGSGTVVVTNSSAKNASDKIFQLNAPGTFIVDNFYAENFGKLIRTNGGQQGDWDIRLSNIQAVNGSSALLQSDSKTVKVSATGVSASGVEKMYVLPESGTLSVQ